MTVSNIVLKNIGTATINATFSYVFVGTREIFGATNETANVQQQWTNQGDNGKWYVLKENWDYQDWYVQTPLC